MADPALDLALPLVAQSEGLRLHAYPDPASPLAQATVGANWGMQPASEILSTLKDDISMRSGAPWTVGFGDTGKHVRPNTQVTRFAAEAQLRSRLADFLRDVRKALTRPASDEQLAAMTSLAYNIGSSAFANSTMVRKFNVGDVTGAAAEFARWTKAAGRIMPGLVSRRAAERALFVGG